MNENVKKAERQSLHTISLENRKRMVLTAIVEVVSATEKTIITKTIEELIHINGEGLRVSKLNLEEELLIIEGKIDNFKYLQSESKKGLLKRIFK